MTTPSGVEPSLPFVDDHPFEAPAGAPWERCVTCGLSEGAHLNVPEGSSYMAHLRAASEPEPRLEGLA